MRIELACTFVLAVFCCANAQAECARPRPKFTIPDGSTATEQDLQKAQAQLLEFDQQVGEYLRCLKGDVSQQTVGKDEQARTKLAQQYVTNHNQAADELAGLAKCFNAQAESFRSSGGGKEAKPADCSAHLAAGLEAAPQPGGTPMPSNVVKEADGHSFDLEDGAWGYTLLRDETPRRCGKDAGKECVVRTVFVTNGSSRELECKAYITYEGMDAEGRPTTQSQAIVLGKTVRAVVSSLAERGVNAQTFEAQCTPRTPLPQLATPSECKYEVVKPVSISDYYPAEARELGEQGPVVVEFTVAGKAANPTDVKVVAGSMYPRLDQGAIQAVSAMVLSSNCKNQRYRLRLSFRLE